MIPQPNTQNVPRHLTRALISFKAIHTPVSFTSLLLKKALARSIGAAMGSGSTIICLLPPCVSPPNGCYSSLWLAFCFATTARTTTAQVSPALSKYIGQSEFLHNSKVLWKSHSTLMCYSAYFIRNTLNSKDFLVCSDYAGPTWNSSLIHTGHSYFQSCDLERVQWSTPVQDYWMLQLSFVSGIFEFFKASQPARTFCWDASVHCKLMSIRFSLQHLVLLTKGEKRKPEK